VLRHPAFAAGDTDTAFFDRHDLPALAAPLSDANAVEVSAIAATLALDAATRDESPVLPTLLPGWRNVVSQAQHRAFQRDGSTVEVHYRLDRAGLTVDGRDDLELIAASAHEVVLAVAGVRYRFAAARYGELLCVDSPLGAVQLHLLPRFPDPSAQLDAGSLLAPMPGTVVRVAVAVGDQVAAGDPVLWLEAMKMQHRIDAPVAGVVTAVAADAGQQVEAGTVLAVVTPEEEIA
jgi:propionyl-CoA carboxylase alpha chain